MRTRWPPIARRPSSLLVESLIFLHPIARPLGVRFRVAKFGLADVLVRLRRREAPRSRRRTMRPVATGATSAVTRALSIPCHGCPPSILFLVFAELYAGIGHLFFCSLTIEMLVSGDPCHCPMEGEHHTRHARMQCIGTTRLQQIRQKNYSPDCRRMSV